MKKIIAVISLALVMQMTFAQNNQNQNNQQPANQQSQVQDNPKQMGKPTSVRPEDVPNAVTRLFLSQNDLSANPQWYKTSEGNYTVSYSDKNKMESRTTYDVSGRIITTDRQVRVAEMPGTMNQYLSSHYAGQNFDKVYVSTDANGNKTYYVMSGDQVIRFDDKGNVIQDKRK